MFILEYVTGCNTISKGKEVHLQRLKDIGIQCLSFIYCL